MKSLTQEAADHIDHMIELLHKQIDTYRQMQKGLLLAELLGVAPKEIKEPLRHHIREGDSPLRPWAGAMLYVRIGDGADRSFKLTDVDRRLWPDHVRQAYERWQKRSATRDV